MTDRKRNLLIGAILGLAVVGFAVWFLIFRDTAPPEASLEDAVGSVSSTTLGVTER